MNLAAACFVTFAPILAVALLSGRLISRATGEQKPSIVIATGLAFGLVGYGVVVIMLGHLQMFRTTVFLVIAVAATCVSVWRYRTLVAWAKACFRGLLETWKASPLLATAVAGVFAMATALQWVSPLGPDERDYKWGTPLAYAAEHGFLEVDARLSNGVYLSQLLSVPAASFRNVIAARWLGLIALLMLAAAVWFITKVFSGDARWAVLLLATSPVIIYRWNGTGSDLLGASLALLAAAWVVSGKLDSRRAAVIGILVAASIATKVIMVAPVAIVLAWALLRARKEGASNKSVLSYIVIFGGSVLGSFALSALQTMVVSGRLSDTRSRPLYPSGSAELARGVAAGRIPSLHDILILPVTPFVSGLRSVEPYGTRIGLLLVVGLALALVAVFIAPSPWRERIRPALLIGAISYFAVAPLFIKTRFLVFSWGMWTAAVGITLGWLRSSVRRSVWILIGAGATCLGGIEMINASVLLLRSLR